MCPKRPPPTPLASEMYTMSWRCAGTRLLGGGSIILFSMIEWPLSEVAAKQAASRHTAGVTTLARRC